MSGWLQRSSERKNEQWFGRSSGAIARHASASLSVNGPWRRTCPKPSVRLMGLQKIRVQVMLH